MFELIWEGKAAAKASINDGPSLVLRCDSNPEDSSGNWFIEGDNLLALKALRDSQVTPFDCIYIDPPYNTGNQFVYNDDFRRSISSEQSGNSASQRQSSNRHTEWLNMIYPRLCLAHEVLKSSGVVFVSIDDSSMAPLRLVMDEIFGIDNYVQTFLWLHGKGKKDKQSRTQHQYVVCFAKNRKRLPVWRQLVTKTYGKNVNPDKDSRGPWFSGSISFSEQRSNPDHANYFTILSPSGIKWTRQWLCSEQDMTSYLKNNQIYFGPTPEQKNVPRLKIFSHESDVVPLNVLDDLGTSRSAMMECAEAFDGHFIFDYPKPVALIEHLLRLACPNGGRILDFFAGSGTTGIASVRLSKQHDADYHCTLVQKPESIDAKHFGDRILLCKNLGLEPNLSALCWHRLTKEKPHTGKWRRFRCTSKD